MLAPRRDTFALSAPSATEPEAEIVRSSAASASEMTPSSAMVSGVESKVPDVSEPRAMTPSSRASRSASVKVVVPIVSVD